MALLGLTMACIQLCCARTGQCFPSPPLFHSLQSLESPVSVFYEWQGWSTLYSGACRTITALLQHTRFSQTRYERYSHEWLINRIRCIGAELEQKKSIPRSFTGGGLAIATLDVQRPNRNWPTVSQSGLQDAAWSKMLPFVFFSKVECPLIIGL